MILRADNQDDAMVVWAAVPDSGEQEKWEFVSVHTGEEFPQGRWAYIDTVLFSNGAYVLHVFARVAL
jgi:hypothetical protein